MSLSWRSFFTITNLWKIGCKFTFNGNNNNENSKVNLYVVKVKVKLLIVNRPSHSSVTDKSGAHLRFQGPELAVCRRCLTCHMGSHTCHPIQANPSLPNIWEEG